MKLRIGKVYGVSDNAIRKRCVSLKIDIPKFPKGYWQKIKVNQIRDKLKGNTNCPKIYNYEEIISKYNEFKNFRKVARMLGCSHSTVRKIVSLKKK